MPTDYRYSTADPTAVWSDRDAKRSSAAYSQAHDARNPYYGSGDHQYYASDSRYASGDSRYDRHDSHRDHYDARYHDDGYDNRSSRYDRQYHDYARRASQHRDHRSDYYAHDSQHRAVDSYIPSQDSRSHSRNSRDFSAAPQGSQPNPSNSELSRSDSLKRGRTRSSSPDSYRRKAIRNARSRAASAATLNLAQPLDNVHINVSSQPKPPASTWTPSEGPTSQDIKDAAKQRGTVPSNVTTQSQAVVNKQDICKLSGRTRSHYLRGQIISLPFHEPNRNPYIDPNHDNLRKTRVGPVFSKRRMAIIMWIYDHDIFCLPLYSFGGRGLRAKHGNALKEYVALRNADDKNFQNHGSLPEVVAQADFKDLDANTAVHLSGGFKVECCDDTAISGRMIESSFHRLVRLWEDLTGVAREQPW